MNMKFGFFPNLGFINLPQGSSTEPTVYLFCLNTLPRQSNARYIWMDNEVWNDTLFWID